MQKDTRRSFLADAIVAGSAFGVLGVAGSQANQPTSTGKRRVVGGSPYPTFSRAVEYNGLVYVAGVLGQKPGTRDLVSAEFEPQARQVLENLKASVEAAGSSFEKVLKCTCFLTDENDFASFNKVYVEYFPKDPPARSTVIVKALVAPGAKVEVDCVACMT